MNGNDDYSHLQQQIEILKQQLAQAQRLTALGELVSTTTHEFNNVLMTILNYAKMGMRHKDTATRDKCFEKILAASNRAATNHQHGAGHGPKPLGRPGTDRSEATGRRHAAVAGTGDEQVPRRWWKSNFQPIPQAYVNGNQIQQVLLNLLDQRPAGHAQRRPAV